MNSVTSIIHTWWTKFATTGFGGRGGWVLESTIATAEFAQVGSRGDAEQASGEEDGSICEALGRAVLEISDAESYTGAKANAPRRR